MLETLGLMLLLWLLGAPSRGAPGVSPSPSPLPGPQRIPPPGVKPEPAMPWPSAPPPTLPPWPSGWEPDEPPPAEVVKRAWELLPNLWKGGPGTKAVEMTGARWITYVAAWHGPAGTVKGVTAFRPKRAAAPKKG